MTQKKKAPADILGDRYRTRISSLSPGLQRVAHYINENRASVAEATALEIAQATASSDATVIRTVQALGFAGLRDLRLTLAEWSGLAINSAAKMSATVGALDCDINASIDFVLQGHQQACDALAASENRQAITRAVATLNEARQVALFGINASGILADYSARLFSRIGLPAVTLNRCGIALAEQLTGLQRGDVLIMMAQKSTHREGTVTLKEAQRLGIPVILLTHALESAFAREADIVINIPRGGEGGRMPLHGTVLLCLEMLILAVASTNAGRTVKSMKRVQEFNRALRSGSGR